MIFVIDLGGFFKEKEMDSQSPFFIYGLILSLIVLSVMNDLPTYIRVKLAARRMNIRDKGYVERQYSAEGAITWTHSFCHTRLRVGIDKLGNFVHYCWRCECVFPDNLPPPPPKGKEGIPLPSEKSNKLEIAKVVQIRPKKSA